MSESYTYERINKIEQTTSIPSKYIGTFAEQKECDLCKATFEFGFSNMYLNKQNYYYYVQCPSCQKPHILNNMPPIINEKMKNIKKVVGATVIKEPTRPILSQYKTTCNFCKTVYMLNYNCVEFNTVSCPNPKCEYPISIGDFYAGDPDKKPTEKPTVVEEKMEPNTFISECHFCKTRSTYDLTDVLYNNYNYQYFSCVGCSKQCKLVCGSPQHWSTDNKNIKDKLNNWVKTHKYLATVKRPVYGKFVTTDYTHDVTCRNCTSTISVTENMIKYASLAGYNNKYYTICPFCDSTIPVRNTVDPIVHDRVSNRCCIIL